MTDLYKLTQDMLDLERELSEATDPDTGDVLMSGDDFKKYLDLEHATAGKIESYLRLMENLAVKAEIRRAEYNAYAKKIKKHYDAAKAAENKIDRLKEWMKYCMEAAGKDRIETDHFTVAVQKNGGQPAVIVPDNPDFKTWPEQLFKIVLEPDKEAIREWDANLQTGMSTMGLPEGVEVVTGTHIRIR